MIQRIQTIYLLGVFVLNIVAYFLSDILYFSSTSPEYLVQVSVYNTLWRGFLLAISALAIVSIFSFKKRQNQFVLNRLSILFNLILLGVLVYQTLSSSGENNISVKGVSVVVPLFSIVMLSIANKAIRRDENLVKSADRLR